MYKNKCAKFLRFAKADFEMIQEIVQKYVKNVVSVSVKITEPKLFRPKISVSVVHYLRAGRVKSIEQEIVFNLTIK